MYLLYFDFFSSARRYNKSKYHLKDIVLGKIYFLLVRIKIKHMELAIIRREQSGQAPNVLNESETLTKFEIMDGAPVRGESIPVGTFLGFFGKRMTEYSSYFNVINNNNMNIK